MATKPDFKYAPMFQMGKDNTEYYLLTKEGVSVGAVSYTLLTLPTTFPVQSSVADEP